MKKIKEIFINSIPVLIMIGLIPIIKNDYKLTIVYLLVITLSLIINKEWRYVKMLLLGFVAMTIFEFIFISTGVETFNRISLLGVMPLWLPVLWSYGFVVIYKSAKVLNI